jgi:hypothetical protein
MILGAILFALLLGAFVFLVLPSGNAWRRGASATIFVLLVAIVFAGSLELLGRPKPLRLEWREAREAEVVSASLREGQGIYVWLQFDGMNEPRAYVLPWDIKMAQQLQTAMQQGQARGTSVKMTKPFSPGIDKREPKFYAAPQRALPAKSYNQVSPINYEGSGGNG